jgi:AraC family transcriptional regulator of adaptative response/methylated-DNA-[protein]-cysteine methyltransferase
VTLTGRAHTTPDIAQEQRAARFADDPNRWAAVVGRDSMADGVFYYSVKTTGVYCRPSCPARPAWRENARFYATTAEAEAAGFRPCKHCRPNGRAAAKAAV